MTTIQITFGGNVGALRPVGASLADNAAKRRPNLATACVMHIIKGNMNRQTTNDKNRNSYLIALNIRGSGRSIGVGIVATKCIDTLERCGVLLLHLRQLYRKYNAIRDAHVHTLQLKNC